MSAAHFTIDHQVGELDYFLVPEKMALDANIGKITKGLAPREIRNIHVANSGSDIDFKPMPEGVGLFRDTPSVNRCCGIEARDG